LSGGLEGPRWPAELAFLLERYPRATWPAHRGRSAAFWLQVHEQLRRDSAGLAAAADAYSSGHTSAAQLAVIAAPRLRGLIARMQGHHQIEDVEYFPAFRETEPRLARGFDLLERDHAELERRVGTALATLGDLHTAAQRHDPTGAQTTLTLAAQRYIAGAARLCEELAAHLTDEENLVVPLLIEHEDY
jgi:iron-sulfur cluster repair protein YtfE (RIC family)